MIFRLIKTLIIVYVSVLVVLVLGQRHLIYHPETYDSYNQTYLDANNIDVVTDGDVLEWLALPFIGGKEHDKNTVVILFHGNGGAAIHRVFKAKLFNLYGYDVVLAEYPGYGTNTDTRPSESAFYEAGRTIIRQTKKDFPGHELIIYGESIGSGTAVQMATEFDIKALIVEVGFSSLMDVAQNIYPFFPVGYLLKDRYDNISKISEVDATLIIIHGEKDTIIPIKYGEKLFDAAGEKKYFIRIDEAGHNDVYDFMAFSQLLEQLN